MLSIKVVCFICFADFFAKVYGDSDQLASIEALVASGRLVEAQQEVSAALRSHPADAGLANVAGIIAAQNGDRGKAEAFFQKAVRAQPQLKAAWLNLGRLYQSPGSTAADANRAIEVFRTVLKLEPGNAEANHQLAVLLLFQGNFAESLKHLDRLNAMDRARLPALIVRCADQAALGQTAGALTVADQILTDATVQEADIAPVLPVLQAHNGPVEARMLEGLVQNGRAGGQTKRRLAALYEEQGKLPAARELYEAVAQAEPASAAELVNLGRVAWKQKDYEATLGYLAHARELQPENASIHFFFGVTCNEMRLPVEARKSLERALQLDPDNPYYNYAMGAVRLQWTDAAAAVPFLKKYVAARQDDARGKLALAMAYFMAGDFDSARAEAARLTSKPQAQVGAEFLLGRMAQKDGETERGIVHFQRAVALDPKASDARAELGALLMERGDAEQARRETQAALSADPDNYTANRTLLHLYQRDKDARAPQQLQRLQSLIQERENKMHLLERTIEVRPF